MKKERRFIFCLFLGFRWGCLIKESEDFKYLSLSFLLFYDFIFSSKKILFLQSSLINDFA